MVKKLTNKKKWLIISRNFNHSREEVVNFFRDNIEMLSDTNYDARQNKTEGTGCKSR